ncbi:MAG: protein kinase, partial [Planctomycetota bacterium]
GMGTVYAATLFGPAGFRKRVAVKILDRSGRDDVRTRLFFREARLGAGLRHPNLLEIYDLGVLGEEHFIAMELVDGASLRAVVRDHGPLPADVVRSVAVQAARGLAHAHRSGGHGVVHRDIKPSNLMLDGRGRLRIVDFGLAAARLASTGRTSRHEGLVGTPGYFSPEQFHGGSVGPRTDLFSLGVVLYEITCGRRLMPCTDRGSQDRALEHLVQRLRRGEPAAEIEALVPGLGRVVADLLEPEQIGRTPSAEALLEQLGPFAGEGAASGWAARMLTGRFRPAPTSDAAETLAPAADTLPRERDAFVGRRLEASTLARALAEAPLVTLKGPGGSGKTRLAVRAARERDARTPAWFVDLSGARDRAGVAQATASALGTALSGRNAAADIDRLGDTLAGWGPTLLVLDNAEQVLDAVGSTIERWCRAAPELRFLVTSRAVLGIPGERVVELGALSTDDGIELFVQRAYGGRDPAAEELHAIRALVGLLDGLPLAIELAAARARLLPPSALLARMDERFRLLGGRKHGPRRQTGLRASLEWSWDLLDPWSRATLVQLSVFEGCFMDAVEAVVRFPEDPDAPWVVDAVADLLDHSLLASETVEGEPRFRLLESVRAFAREKARELALEELGSTAATDSTASERRHVEHYARAGSEAACRGYLRHGGLQRRRRAGHELANIEAALTRAVQDRRFELAVDLTHAAEAALESTGPLRRARGHFESVLQALPSPLPESLVRPTARLRSRLAWSLYRLGHAEEALEQADAALAAVPDDDPLYGSFLSMRARSLGTLGRRREAIALLEQAAAFHRERNDPAAGSDLVNIGVQRMRAGLPKDPALLPAALRLHRRAGNERGRITCLGNLASRMIQEGRLDDAETHLREAIRLSAAARHLPGECAYRSNLGLVLSLSGRSEAALLQFAQALEQARRLGAVHHLARAEAFLAEEALRAGSWTRAEEGFRRAIEGAARVAYEGRRVWLAELAYVVARQGRAHEADALLGKAEALPPGQPAVEAGLDVLRARVRLLLRGDRPEAEAALARARALAAATSAGESGPIGRWCRELEAELSGAVSAPTADAPAGQGSATTAQ